ncbi:hypothetical protein FGIG_07765 [Fasciola gigantica]|uniref:C-type lectin domain-containing protein n=1 Tax=Fasciola gigantica TaxID=46835 RepID=A0A504YCJ9_FASGI|nr:hypothetical protein FGIG_07765 [Fasciola gigantica]
MFQSTITDLLIILSMCTQFSLSACPSNLTEVAAGICMLAIPHEGTYCEAHAFCETEGQARGLRLILPGKNSPLIPSIVPSTSIVFTGTSALLNQSTNLREGWRYGDPGWSWFTTSANDTSILWSDGEPNLFQASVALYFQHRLCDESQLMFPSTHVVCEMSTYQLNGPMEAFKRNWPYPISSMFLSNNHSVGCFDFVAETTMVACAFRCKCRIVCRSFYHNAEAGLCGLSLYVDSLLPANMSNITGNWMRFGRPNG